MNADLSIEGLKEVDPVVFRNVVGHFASGVTVITTALDGVLYGTTASAVSSLSMEPPMMLACLNRSSSTHDKVIEAGVYAISILAEDQVDLAMRFGRKGGDKFDGVDYQLTQEGVPVLEGALATIVCRVVETAQGGTHTIFLGLVTDAQAFDRRPLAYYRGTMGRLEPLQELAAYEATREWVLLRHTPLGGDLDYEAVADELQSKPVHVHNALVKLESEHLVYRTGLNTFRATPITADLCDGIYDSRATIQAGVIAAHLEKLTDQTVEELRSITEELGQMRDTPEVSPDEYLMLGSTYHEKLVSVAGSAQLMDSFNRLSIGTIWRQLLTRDEWGRRVDRRGQLVALTDALDARNGEAALSALALHTDGAKKLARELITRHGGAI